MRCAPLPANAYLDRVHARHSFDRGYEKFAGTAMVPSVTVITPGAAMPPHGSQVTWGVQVGGPFGSWQTAESGRWARTTPISERSHRGSTGGIRRHCAAAHCQW